jgi:hypothetical protein
MRRRATAILVGGLVLGTLSSASALVVTDPLTTARNAVTAVLKSQIVDTLVEQHRRLRRMARRLSAHTNLDKYALPDPPKWRTHGSDDFQFSQAYNDALIFGDSEGAAYLGISRSLVAADDAMGRLSPAARDALMAQLATLHLTDATVIAGTHQTGQLRFNGRKFELQAIEALEANVIDPSQEQSATAVLDKISGAALIGTRQKQARLQLLTGIVEQLLVESKRARDTESVALNMQLNRLRFADWGEGGGSMLAGASHHLRTWRQP